YSLKDAIATEELKPPQGFTAVQLGDIAEINVGLSKNKVGLNDAPSQEGLRLINARNIRADGNLNINDAAKITITNRDDVSSIKALSDFQLRPGDILITAISSELRLALWPT